MLYEVPVGRRLRMSTSTHTYSHTNTHTNTQKHTHTHTHTHTLARARTHTHTKLYIEIKYKGDYYAEFDQLLRHKYEKKDKPMTAEEIFHAQRPRPRACGVC